MGDLGLRLEVTRSRGGKWYLEICGSWKIFIRSQNLGSLYEAPQIKSCFSVFNHLQVLNCLSLNLALQYLGKSWILPFVTP